MPTLTTWETMKTSENEDNVSVKHEVNDAEHIGFDKIDEISAGKEEPQVSAALTVDGTVVSKQPSPAVTEIGKRKATKITPTSERAEKRKKQQVVSNQLSIVSFFHRQPNSKKNSPLSPLLVGTQSEVAASNSQLQNHNNVKSSTLAPQNPSKQPRSYGASVTVVGHPTDSLAMLGQTNDAAHRTPLVATKGIKISNKKPTSKNHIPSREFLREIVVGPSVSSLRPIQPLAGTSLSPCDGECDASTRASKASCCDDLLPRITPPAALIKSITGNFTQFSTEICLRDPSSSDESMIDHPTELSTSVISPKEVPTTLDSTKTVVKEMGDAVLLDNTDASDQVANLATEPTTEVTESEYDGSPNMILNGLANDSATDNVESDVVDPDGLHFAHAESIMSENSTKVDTPKSNCHSVLEQLPALVVQEGDVDDREATEDVTTSKLELKHYESTTNSQKIDVSITQLTRIGTVQAMQLKYCKSAKEMVVRGRNGLEEENFAISLPNEVQPIESNASDFPDVAVPILALLVEGSRLPLSILAPLVASRLNEIFESHFFTSDVAAAKIKIVAKRESFVDNQVLSTMFASAPTKTNIFEDENPDRMWRWEFVSLDLFSDKSLLIFIKKARSARRKLRSHLKALSKLLLALTDFEKLLSDYTTAPEMLDAADAKVSQEESQVLKFEQEQEKSRIANEARKKKQEDHSIKRTLKQNTEAREEKIKQKVAEREEVKRLKAEEKQRQKAERDEAKRKVDEEKDKERTQQEEKLKRQQAQMRSFFGPKPTITDATELTTPDVEGHDADNVAVQLDFLAQINSSVATLDSRLLFHDLSQQASKSRQRRTRRVPVPVYVPAISGDPFDGQPYLEQKTLLFPNKYKFLSFHEDCRPAYHGTWSKKSKLITGRRPFRTDASFLDYENDSEAEWEEGDDELGEDIESNCQNDENEDVLEDEEGDPSNYNFEDGWMQRDDDFGCDIDEETKLLLQKKLQSEPQPGSEQNGNIVACVFTMLTPGFGLHDNTSASGNIVVEGLKQEDAMDLLSSHEAEWLGSLDLCLDTFPPLVDESLITEDAGVVGNADPAVSSGKTGYSELNREDLRTFAHFVHHNKVSSKEKLLDEFKNQHKSLLSSRAQGTRTLISIAEKKRDPRGGILWEVKRDVLMDLGLDDLVMAQENEVPLDMSNSVTPEKHRAQNSPSSANAGQSERKSKDSGFLLQSCLKFKPASD